jgi:N-hydroxyarylamine O-acetyltransferase
MSGNDLSDNSGRLKDYLARIGFRGVPGPDLATLSELQRTHVRAVPFENLDVQLGRPIVMDPDACYDKVVHRRRGGWCFELNGVLSWALREIGFDVVRLSGGVRRETAGDKQLGNHLCLLVRLDKPYLVDVGFGSSLSQPIPLEASSHVHSPYHLTLSKLNDGYWRFSERTSGDPFSYDFRTDPADENRFADYCARLQTDADSIFVQNLLVQRRDGDKHLALRGRVLMTRQGADADKRVLGSADELVATLRETFDLDMPDAAALWPAICARHDTLFGG